MEILLAPPLAFLIYMAILLLLGRVQEWRKSPLYASGEEHVASRGVTGHRSFFVGALFFAALHLGALVLGSGIASPAALLYLAGLAVALIVLLVA